MDLDAIWKFTVDFYHVFDVITPIATAPWKYLLEQKWTTVRSAILVSWAKNFTAPNGSKQRAKWQVQLANSKLIFIDK